MVVIEEEARAWAHMEEVRPGWPHPTVGEICETVQTRTGLQHSVDCNRLARAYIAGSTVEVRRLRLEMEEHDAQERRLQDDEGGHPMGEQLDPRRREENILDGRPAGYRPPE